MKVKDDPYILVPSLFLHSNIGIISYNPTANFKTRSHNKDQINTIIQTRSWSLLPSSSLISPRLQPSSCLPPGSCQSLEKSTGRDFPIPWDSAERVPDKAPCVLLPPCGCAFYLFSHKSWNHYKKQNQSKTEIVSTQLARQPTSKSIPVACLSGPPCLEHTGSAGIALSCH